MAPLTYNARTAPSTAPPSDHKRDRGTFMADDGLSRLTDDEKTASIALLKRTIADYRYPLSPRITTLKGILANLQPPKPAPPPLSTTPEGVCPATRGAYIRAHVIRPQPTSRRAHAPIG